MSSERKFAFLFYPGEYLRDTQCLNTNAQVAYDRIMCEHMRNICITHEQLVFFTKRLNDDERGELLLVLDKVDGGYQIPWVAESITRYNSFAESRRKNRLGKTKEHMNNTSQSYGEHMVSVSVNEKEKRKVNTKNGAAKKTSVADLIPANWPRTEFDTLWKEFVEMRSAKKKPLTSNASVRRVEQLMSISDRSWLDAKKIMLRAIDKAWDEFYPLDKPQPATASSGYGKEMIRDKA